MKTFKQFLSEEEVRNLIKFLQANCNQALHDFSAAGKFLWRGIRDAKKELKDYAFERENFKGFISSPRQDRIPLNTPKWAHGVFNEFFKKEFGEPLRSTTLFAVAERHRAFGSHNPFAIIPIDDYTIYWSPKVQDLTVYAFPGDLLDETEEHKTYLLNVLRLAGYKKGPNIEALQSHSELMVKCKSYLALEIGEAQLKTVVQTALNDQEAE